MTKIEQDTKKKENASVFSKVTNILSILSVFKSLIKNYM